jgi:sensor histidine kinase regulating citrate/malate metabolism
MNSEEIKGILQGAALGLILAGLLLGLGLTWATFQAQSQQIQALELKLQLLEQAQLQSQNDWLKAELQSLEHIAFLTQMLRQLQEQQESGGVLQLWVDETGRFQWALRSP